MDVLDVRSILPGLKAEVCRANLIKLKCSQRQEFVIGGYTDPKGTRQGFGALLLGVHDAQGRLQYVGNVGTGFDENNLTALAKQLAGLNAPASPFAGKTGIDRNAHWVRPQLVAEVAFAGWTDSNRFRHAVFNALRSDKLASDITRETTDSDSATPALALAVPETRASDAAAPAKNGKRLPALPAASRVTHPDKIIDAQSGTTKIDVVRYYAMVAPMMLPHLANRPTALVRAPDGVAGQLSFQKHAEHAAMAGIVLLDPALYPGHAPLLKVARAEGLLAAAQINVIEFHTWNALEDAIAKPDRMCFDLDPGADVEWPGHPRRSAAGARDAALARAGIFHQDQRRQGAACSGTVETSLRLGGNKGFLACDRRPSGQDHTTALRCKKRTGKSDRQGVCGLPTQWFWCDDRSGLVGTIAARAGCVGTDRLGRTCRGQRRRPLVPRERRCPARNRQQTMGRLCQRCPEPDPGHATAGSYRAAMRWPNGHTALS